MKTITNYEYSHGYVLPCPLRKLETSSECFKKIMKYGNQNVKIVIFYVIMSATKCGNSLEMRKNDYMECENSSE